MIHTIWFSAFVLFVIVEASTTQLVCIWMAFGSLAAFLVSMASPEGYILQGAVFLLVSAVSFAATRPLARRIRRRSKVPTNADAVIGKTARTLTCVGPADSSVPGRVELDGTDWAAVSQSGVMIPEGSTVVIRGIEGVKVLVVPASANSDREKEY